jgi:hypothetical protein
MRVEMALERRQSPRIDILGELQGQAILLDETIEIRQMSEGGITIVTRYPFKIQSLHDFQLTAGSESMIVSGRIVHRRMLVERDETFYVLGVQFIDVAEKAGSWIREFLHMLPVGVRV